MEELEGRVAVVTGAASGIGRALIDRFAAAGMRVVLADVEEEALDKAEAEVAGTGAETLAVVTDVSSRASVDALAAAVDDRFGATHVLCNNAGVSGGMGALWETTDKDWAWVLGVNLMGVVHGIQAFVPGMVARGEPGHVVNTASVLGLATGGGSIYGVSKHAVTRLTEGLWYDLQAAGAPIGVSVLCPGMIATNIIGSGRNRPADLQNEGGPAGGPEVEQRMRFVHDLFAKEGMPPGEVAEMVHDAVRRDRFYILTHPDAEKETVRARMEAILGEQSPPPPRPDGGFMSMGRRREPTG
ncbi:MAG TPA: SDR family NAD(P)-dependent oxidoreductase [Acidimicrobiales bacterium]|nr:SDR family NAD(P)-dependent oxidoreductase [Acidimicrobiales bacterium]